jgi:hypothetical protein
MDAKKSQSNETNRATKLQLSKETLRNLRVRTNVRTGAPPSGTGTTARSGDPICNPPAP